MLVAVTGQIFTPAQAYGVLKNKNLVVKHAKDAKSANWFVFNSHIVVSIGTGVRINSNLQYHRIYVPCGNDKKRAIKKARSEALWPFEVACKGHFAIKTRLSAFSQAKYHQCHK